MWREARTAQGATAFPMRNVVCHGQVHGRVEPKMGRRADISPPSGLPLMPIWSACARWCSDSSSCVANDAGDGPQKGAPPPLSLGVREVFFWVVSNGNGAVSNAPNILLGSPAISGIADLTGARASRSKARKTLNVDGIAASAGSLWG